MANNITNKLTVIGTEEQIKEVFEFIKIEKTEESQDINGLGTIDFNKITPMPKWIYGSSPKVIGISGEDEEKYGEENTCLKWARNNWGTKWNAYGQSDERSSNNTIYFETAWNGIPELISKLAWIFPKLIIEYGWADEDFGYNVAKYKFKDTEVLEVYRPEGGSKQAYELALEITQSTPEEHYLKFNTEIDNYEYLDED